MGFDVVAVEPSRGMRDHASNQGVDGIRWLADRLPALDDVHRLGLSFDLLLLSAVWQHVAPADRQRAFRKLASLLAPGGLMVITLRSGPPPAERPMHPTSIGEIEALARVNGVEIIKVAETADLQGRAAVSWTTMALRMPDDGAGALPLVRGIVLADDKSSTYKLGLLRSIARIAEHAPAAALPQSGSADAVELPLGLVALFWVRMYLPLVRHGLPQTPRNAGPDGLGFAKTAFRFLLADDVDPADLRIGATLAAERGAAVLAAVGEAASTIATMPANFTRFPNSDRRVFEVRRERAPRAAGVEITLERLRAFGSLAVPGHLWRALSRFGPWVEPMLVAEWARLTRSYSVRMGRDLPPGTVEAALAWRDPVRNTTLARHAAGNLIAAGGRLECVWTGRPLSLQRSDIDHCLPWTAWPCGDLWNLVPCDPRVNRHEKRDRLPSAATFADSRERMIAWWDGAYLADPALGVRLLREAAAALPLASGGDASDIYSALDWRRLRLLRDQQVPEWTATAGGVFAGR